MRSPQRRRPTVRLFGQAGDEAVGARSGYEINMPRLDAGVRWRALAKARASSTNSRGTGFGARTSASNDDLAEKYHQTKWRQLT